MGNFRCRHSHSQVITMSSAEDKLLNQFKVKCFFSIFKHCKCFASLCCLVITLPAKTSVKLSAFQKKSVLSRHNGFESELQNCNEHSLKAFSSSFFHFLIILFYNHESSTWSLFMQETLLVESQACRRRGRRTRATNISGRNVSMAPKIYKWQPWIVLCLIMLCFISC